MKTNRFQDFVSKIKNVGVAKPSLFLIELPPPPFLAQDADQTRIDMITLLCQEAFLPQIQLNTTDVQDDGLSREVVVNKKYGRGRLVFLCDQDMVIRKYFEDWVGGVIASKGGTFAYPSEYTVDTITVNQLNAARGIVYTVEIHDAYPVEVEAAALSMRAGNEVHTVAVDFVYRWWQSTARSTDANLSNVPDNISTFLENQTNRNVPGIAQIKSLNKNMKSAANIGKDITGSSDSSGTAQVNGQTFNFN